MTGSTRTARRDWKCGLWFGIPDKIQRIEGKRIK
jgi:hypothetical protein